MIMAARWAYYKPKEFFEELDGMEQAQVVAAYRCSTMIDAVVANEQAKEAKRAAKVKKK